MLTLTQKFINRLYITYIGVIVKTVKKPVKYKSLSLPEPLFKEMKKYVQKNPNYRNMAEFLRQAVREKMESEIALSKGEMYVHGRPIPIIDYSKKISGHYPKTSTPIHSEISIEELTVIIAKILKGMKENKII